MRASVVLLLLVAFTALIVATSVSAASPRKRNKKPKRELIIETGPSEEDAEDTGVLGQLVSYSALAERGREYYHETHRKRFQGKVLGYVTPWNRQGYEVAARFNAKFAYIAPVWYQLKKADGQLALQGGHEVNRTWIQELQTPATHGATVPKLVPRVILELDPQDMVELVSYPDPAVKLLLDECETQHYDGLVLEAWVQWVAMNGMNNDLFRAAALAFVMQLARALHKSKAPKELIVVVPPVVPSHYRGPYFNTTDFLALQQVVDGFSVMTYDFADGVHAGPSSPTHWVRTNIDVLLKAAESAPKPAGGTRASTLQPSPGKLLMGTNFYGYKFRTDSQAAASAVVASEFFALLQKHAPVVEWDAEHEEHYITFKERRKKQYKLYFPTPASLQARLELAAELGVGLSIWELGQGMERFLDLL